MKTLLDYIEDAKCQIQEVSLDEGEALLKQGVNILDVREPGEYLAGTLTGAINVPRGVLEPAVDLEYEGANPELRDARLSPWMVVCKSGGRAALATQTLQEMGFKNVVNLIGGMDAWTEAGKTIEMPSDEHMTVSLKAPCRLDA